MTMFRKVLTASVVAIALASVPAHLAAQEGPARAADRIAVLDWFSGICRRTSRAQRFDRRLGPALLGPRDARARMRVRWRQRSQSRPCETWSLDTSHEIGFVFVANPGEILWRSATSVNRDLRTIPSRLRESG